MEQSIIDYIYYSDHDMLKQIEANVEFIDIERRNDRLMEKLISTFTEEQKELFDRYEENVRDEYCVIGRIYFKMGTKVGIRIVA